MEITYIILGILLLIVMTVVVQANRKAVYAKTVYLEFDKTSDGQQLKYILQHHNNEELRLNMVHMQIEILKRAYSTNLPPSDAATAMAGALDQLLREYENAG